MWKDRANYSVVHMREELMFEAYFTEIRILTVNGWLCSSACVKILNLITLNNILLLLLLLLLLLQFGYRLYKIQTVCVTTCKQ